MPTKHARPSWAYDIDNETMFYTSITMWDLFKDNPSWFGDDEREARRVALIAAEVFERRHANADWDEEDYSSEIDRYVTQLRKAFDSSDLDPTKILKEEDIETALKS